MKKLIKLEFNNTTRERKTEDSYSELYSYDKNNGSFEFEILNDTLTTEQVIALFKFTESNKIWKTTGTVEGNKVNVTFDTSLITQNETVICYLYFDEEQRTSDTFRFKFKVKVSEIDKMSRYEVKERFINNTVIVDRLDVVTKTELQEALKNVGGIATEGLLTEVKAEEIYAKKSDAVDNTNFELVKNRVLALELKTDKDTVYDDSDLKARVEVLEQKTDKDTVYDDTPLKERVTALESKAIEGGAYDDSDLRNRVVALETKEDKDTKYDDTEVKHRLTELENKPAVDTSVFVTEEKLSEKGYLTKHQDLTPYALKSEIPQPYNDTPLNERITALENKPTTGGSVDTTNFVTKEELADATPATLYEIYRTDTLKETLDEHVFFINPRNVARDAGKIYLNPSSLVPKVFKGDIGNEKTVDLDVVMYSVANSLPDGYTLSDVENDINNKVTFLSNKNFAEVVPKDELKNIIREVGGAGETVDTSHFITNEILESKNYLTQHQPLDNLVTKEELNSKGYVTDEALNSKGYLTEHQNISHLVTNDELNSKGYLTEEVLNSKNYLTEDVLNTKNYLTQHQDLSSLVTKQELENKHYLTEHQPLSHLVTTSDLEVLRNISVNKAEFNSFKDNVVTKTELAEKGYLTTQYDDTDVKNRIQALENRPTTGGTQTQDTGWLKVSGENAIAGNIVEIRRIGNTVHVRFRNEKNGDFIIVENIYSILDKEISGGFGSITNNSPIFSSKNNRELGRIITNVSNNRITVESMIDGELSNSKVVYINEFSYITDEPFPTNLH